MLGFTPDDWTALRVTALLACVSLPLLLLIATPLAWGLASARGRWKPFAEAVIALPLVLPPTVMGFYLLMLLSPAGLSFSFAGLVVASTLSSLPFAVQPLQGAFEAVERVHLETAASLNAAPLDRFFSVLLPLSRRGFLTAVVLSFAHTLGEFGVLLMVGGNIPGMTKVASIAIYEYVETLNFASAHRLALLMLLVAFAVLVLVYSINGRFRVRLP